MVADDFIDRHALIMDTEESLEGENITPIYREFLRRGKRATMTEAEAFDAARGWYGDRDAIRTAVAALRAARIGMVRNGFAVQDARNCYPYEALFRLAY